MRDIKDYIRITEDKSLSFKLLVDSLTDENGYIILETAGDEEGFWSKVGKILKVGYKKVFGAIKTFFDGPKQKYKKYAVASAHLASYENDTIRKDLADFHTGWEENKDDQITFFTKYINNIIDNMHLYKNGAYLYSQYLTICSAVKGQSTDEMDKLLLKFKNIILRAYPNVEEEYKEELDKIKEREKAKEKNKS